MFFFSKKRTDEPKKPGMQFQLTPKFGIVSGLLDAGFSVEHALELSEPIANALVAAMEASVENKQQTLIMVRDGKLTWAYVSL